MVLISNTSNVPLIWHASGDLSNIAVSPLGSTLAVGDATNVSIIPKLGVMALSTVVSIDADVAPSQTIQISGLLSPTVVPPPDIDFGNVPTNFGFGGPTVFIPVSAWVFTGYSGVGLTSSNRDSFPLSGYAPNFQSGGLGWTLAFNPVVLGPQQTTITFNANFTPACAPNSFIARGVGVAP